MDYWREVTVHVDDTRAVVTVRIPAGCQRHRRRVAAEIVSMLLRMQRIRAYLGDPLMSDPTVTPQPADAPVPLPKPTFWERVRPYLLQVLTALLAGGGIGAGTYHVCRPTRPDRPRVEPAPADGEGDPPRPRRHYGWVRPDPAERPDRVFAAPAGGDALPAAAHLMAPPAPGVPAGLPFDQGQLGSCGPNSAAAAIMYADLRAGRKGLPPPSRLFVYYMTRSVMGTVREDSGVSNAAMVRALSAHGYCDEDLWPYRVEAFRQRPPAAAVAQAAGRKVTDSWSVPQDLATMKAAIAGGRPVVFGFLVHASFESAAVEATGIVPMPRPWERVLGGHDVLLVGYDDRRAAFRFVNSYGPGWGDGGFGWIPYRYATDADLAGDFWAIGSGRP